MRYYITKMQVLTDMEAQQANRAGYEAWLADRPESVRRLATAYPADTLYRIRPNAPYLASHPGSIVSIYSYHENGDIGVVVLAHDDQRVNGPVRVNIDPKWLEPVSVDEAFGTMLN